MSLKARWTLVRSLPVDKLVLVLRSLPALRSMGALQGVAEAVEALWSAEEAGGAARPAPLLLDSIAAWALSRREAEAVLRQCPALRHVELRYPHPGVLPLLAGLPGLRSLLLSEFEPRELLELLQAAGDRITRLELHPWNEPWLGDWGVLPLERVAALCPALEVLHCRRGDVTVSGSQPWPALRHLTVKCLSHR